MILRALTCTWKLVRHLLHFDKVHSGYFRMRKNPHSNALLYYYFDCNAEMSHIPIDSLIGDLFVSKHRLSCIFMYSTYHLSIYAQSILSEQKWTSAKFKCNKQPLNVKLVIKIQMCWRSSPLKSCNSLSLSFSFWMDFISPLIARTISQCAWISFFNYILKYCS